MKTSVKMTESPNPLEAMSTEELYASLARLSESFVEYVEAGDKGGAAACHMVSTAVARELSRRKGGG